MKAVRVHGGGEVLLRISCRFGRLGWYEPLGVGMDTLSGRDDGGS
jgi:hypothetical protein